MFENINTRRKTNLIEENKSVTNTTKNNDAYLNNKDLNHFQQSYDYEPTYKTLYNSVLNNNRTSTDNDIEKDMVNKKKKTKVGKFNKNNVDYQYKDHSIKAKSILSDERIYLNNQDQLRINDYIVNIEKNAIIFTFKKFKFKKYILDMNKIHNHNESSNNFFDIENDIVAEIIKDSVKELMKNEYQTERNLRFSKYYLEIPILLKINKFEKIKYLRANLDTNHLDNTIKSVEKMLKENFSKLSKIFSEAYSKNIQLNQKKDEYRRLYNDLYA